MRVLSEAASSWALIVLGLGTLAFMAVRWLVTRRPRTRRQDSAAIARRIYEDRHERVRSIERAAAADPDIPTPVPAWVDQLGIAPAGGSAAASTPSHRFPLDAMEPVPEPAWWSNLRSLLAKEDWDRLRRRVYRQARYRCVVCAGQGPDHPVEAHEAWHYDDERHVQTLSRLLALCPDCHKCCHLGLARKEGRLEASLAHFRRITGGEPDLDGMATRWFRRNEHSWSVDLGHLTQLGFSRRQVEDLERQAAVERA